MFGKLRSKRIWIPTTLAVLGLAVGGALWAASATSDDLSGNQRDRVVAAARQVTGPGEVISVESSDRDRDGEDAADRDEAYEVEIRKADGTEVEVSLDEDLQVTPGSREDDRSDDANEQPEAEDRVLSAAEHTRAEKAAVAAVGGGHVTRVEASDDRGVAYEVDVQMADGTEWDVDLDSSFAVVQKSIDR